MSSQTIALAAGLLLAVPIQAHHSLDATYDLKKEVVVEGRIVTLLLRNPHSFLQIEVPGKNGIPERWTFEWKSVEP